MNNNINILSFGADKSGFYRVSAELPPGNAKHFVSIKGQDLGSPFLATDSVIICSNSFVEVYPKIILVNDDGSLSHEKIIVKFNTDEFTPMGIYSTLGILKGDKLFKLLTHEENKIKNFERSLDGKKNKFVFEFPQGDKKLSDMFAKDENNKTLMFSMSQPLVIILETSQYENYKVSNHKQLSQSNLANRFGSPVKFVKSSDFEINIKNIIGDEDNPGLITFELGVSKINGYGIPNQTDFPIISIETIQEKTATQIYFYGYKPDFTEFLNAQYFENSYFSNIEVNLLQSGILYVPETDESFVIERSTSSSGSSRPGEIMVIIEDDILNNLTKDDGTYYDMIVSDFLPTHYRIRSDRGDVSIKNRLIISKYDSNRIEYETIFGTDTILDDGNIYIELIDEITNVSLVKKIDIERSQILTPTTSTLSNQYIVSSIFFTDFNPDREIFWNPIITSIDGDLGLSSNDHIVYLRLNSNREIRSISGYIQIGNELVNIRQFSPDNSGENPNLSPNSVGGKVLDIAGTPIKNALINFQIVLNRNIDLPSLSTTSNDNGLWSQSGFIEGQTYIATIVNNENFSSPGINATFSPEFHQFKLSGQSIGNLDYILSAITTPQSTQNTNQTGNSSNNDENNSNTFILKNDNKTAYIKLNFDEILSSDPEQNLTISSDIKVFDTKGNTFTIRL